MSYIEFLILGVGNGAIYAALALALVVTFRHSGVINFATASIALYTAYSYAYLRQGSLFDPVPGLPVTYHFTAELSFFPAAALALVIGCIVGALQQVLVVRPLRGATPVAKAVASIGVLLFLEGLISQRVGVEPISVAPIFPTGVIDIGGRDIPADRLWLAASIIVLGLVLTAVFRFTRFGLLTRAVTETEKGALVSGLSPDRIGAMNALLSTLVAGIGGILVAPIIPLVPEAYTLLIVPALAAALVARFDMLLVAVGAGLAVGMLQSEATFLQTAWSWFPHYGMADVVPLVIIVIVLLAGGDQLRRRDTPVTRTLGQAPRPTRILLPTIITAVAAIVLMIVLSASWRAALVTSAIFAVLALSTVVATGYLGQVALAQLTIAGASGFLLWTFSVSLGLSAPLAVLLSVIGSGILGLSIGVSSMRARGMSSAVVTLALAVAITAVWFSNPSWTGGFSGANISGPELFGVNFSIGSGLSYPTLAFSLLCVGVALVVGVLVALVRRSQLGTSMVAVRADERSAAAVGIHVERVKVTGLLIASLIAGIAGVLLAYQQQTITADTFDPYEGLAFFGAIYLAGITSVSGGLVAGIVAPGGVIFFALDEWIHLGTWYGVVTAVGLIVTVIFNPEGVVGPAHRFLQDRRRGSGRPGLLPVRRPGAPVGGAGVTAGAEWNGGIRQ